MDSEETPLHGMEEVEAPATTDATVGRPGTGSGKSPMQCLQWPWTVVECRCIASERSATHSLLPKTGSYLTDGGGPLAHSEALASVFMNRRIRNRTSGGVGGRRGWKHPRLLPDGRPAPALCTVSGPVGNLGPGPPDPPFCRFQTTLSGLVEGSSPLTLWSWGTAHPSGPTRRDLPHLCWKGGMCRLHRSGLFGINLNFLMPYPPLLTSNTSVSIVLK